ncbi:ATP-dependent protease [Methanomicrobiaceae archaeon CYW5]|uniref:Lon protease family protein n=1 Tax=Methanovulcanius yangii TaxID=1789227 RepID=UPI0029C9B7D5|nr:AAA family ATPase [Methanovulcanius yangii]MBT8507574.1 ATP-dependent protease [Methanovulcanius yangii]
MITPLPPEQYRHRFDATLVDCTSTRDLKPLEEIVGQKRALAALTLGLNIGEKGFNIYVSGIYGTGRKTAVKKFLAELAKTRPQANDWIYVNNFENPYEPNAIRLPPGMGKEFRDDMAAFIEEAKRFIPKVFESEDYVDRRNAAIQGVEEEKGKLIEHVNEVAAQKGFVIQAGPQGLLSLPLKETGEPYQPEEFAALPPEVQAAFQKAKEELMGELRTTFRQLRELDQKGGETVETLNRDVALTAIGHRVAALKDKYEGIDEIHPYIDAVQKDIVENLIQFMPEAAQQQLPPQFANPFFRELALRKYEVNVIVDNTENGGAPVVFEQNPSYQNLFGKIEKEVQYGVVATDFTMIRPGSIHKANGGFLVMLVEDLFRNQFSWDGLKTALKTDEVVVEEPGERMGFISTKGIKPEPIPLGVKVVLIGTPEIYQILMNGDPDFSEFFKVRADFDTVMDRTEENVRNYASFICGLCEENDLRHLDPSGVARVIEYGSRLADDQNKLTTRFSRVADIIREASYYAGVDGEEYTSDRHIMKAVEEKIYRSNLIQEKVQEYITKGIFLIDTEGETVGQVNGLSVMGLGDIAFGRPSRVTASIGTGRGGIIDIEREAAMGGPTHTKGVLILSGYMNAAYAQDKPLSLSARLVFEQSYGGVDGDSASSTELYSILSALSGLPINQAIAVTGSVNQKGEVQAIGGVNEKLEGYYEVCKAKGLTGRQGAMIPASNVQNLMLKDEIIEAGKEGKFTIYPVATIDEGIEVLTGVPAGKRGPDGTFEEGTVNFLVDKRLREMAETMKEFKGGA